MLAGTFTIVGRCGRTGQMGVALSTAIPAGGAICPFTSGHGAISTQSFNNYLFGVDGLSLLAEGLAAAEVVEVLLRGDPGQALRQVLVLDAAGHAACFTGDACVPAAGHRTGIGWVAAGNMLTGEDVLEAMGAAFEADAGPPLTRRLMAALAAGQAAGGDLRGKQSAALKVAAPGRVVPVCDLRVDEHAQPVAELARILAVAERELLPFMAQMPTRLLPDPPLEADLARRLRAPVSERGE